jgi:hypothetical protein
MRLRGLKRLGMGPLNLIVDIEVLLSQPQITVGPSSAPSALLPFRREETTRHSSSNATPYADAACSSSVFLRVANRSGCFFVGL